MPEQAQTADLDIPGINENNLIGLTDGAIGPSPSRCMSIPTKPSLEMIFDPLRLIGALLGKPPYTCTP